MRYGFVSIAVSIGLLSGCASQPQGAAQSGSGKLTVTQVGRGQNANHVFCEEGRCDERTPKVVAVPAVQKQAPAPQKVLPAPEKFSVHFRWSWAKLDANGQKELGAVVSRIAGKPVKSIEVAGRTDPTGSKAYNKKLAKRRAETVKAALVKAGFPASVIHTNIQTPCCDGDLSASRAQMQPLRRTDIEITITTNE